MSDRLTLAAGALSVELAPAVGGCIVAFERNDGDTHQPLLRGAGGIPASVLDAACFPLVPFANRIRGGSFVCDGRTVTLRPNMPGDASPMHGQGWQAVWTVAEASPRHAVLEYRHEAGAWPWTYHATQRVELDEHGLSLTLSCTNVAAERMPCGLGFHPYYPCDARTVLDSEVTHAWTVDAQVLPVERVGATGRYDLHDRRICGQALDNGFDGWSGAASIRWSGHAAALRLSSPDAGRFQVYSPAAGGVFVAEPVQNANCALNAPQEQWPALGLTLLDPGARAALHARFDVVVA